jgi:hypothetical protein
VLARHPPAVLGAGRGALTHRETVATLKTSERREWCACARRSAARMALVSRINRDGDIQFTGKGAPRDQPEVCRPPYRGLWSFYLCSWVPLFPGALLRAMLL